MEFTRPRGTRDFLFEEMEERKKALLDSHADYEIEDLLEVKDIV